MEEISDPAAIILKLDKMHRNMVADGTWSNTNEKDTKIVALTSALDNVKKRFGELAKKVGFSSDIGEETSKTVVPTSAKEAMKRRVGPRLVVLPGNKSLKRAIPSHRTAINMSGALITTRRTGPSMGFTWPSLTIMMLG